jgi:hypothetical protein
MPPQWGMQDKWEKAHNTEADFARDRRDEMHHGYDSRGDGVSPRITSSAPICFSHFFDSWKQYRSGKGG